MILYVTVRIVLRRKDQLLTISLVPVVLQNQIIVTIRRSWLLVMHRTCPLTKVVRANKSEE